MDTTAPLPNSAIIQLLTRNQPQAIASPCLALFLARQSPPLLLPRNVSFGQSARHRANNSSGTMAVAPDQCAHTFQMIKSESTMIQWLCASCHSGPHWWIFECRYCRIHLCRGCMHAM